MYSKRRGQNADRSQALFASCGSILDKERVEKHLESSFKSDAVLAQIAGSFGLIPDEVLSSIKKEYIHSQSMDNVYTRVRVLAPFRSR